MAEHNYVNDEDKYFPKRPTAIMNSKEQIIKFSSFDKYLENIWNQDDERGWESFLKGVTKSNGIHTWIS